MINNISVPFLLALGRISLCICIDTFFTFFIIHPHILKSAEVNMKLFTGFPTRQELTPFKWYYCSLITFMATATEEIRGRAWKICIMEKNSTHENRCWGLDYWKQTETIAGNKGNVQWRVKAKISQTHTINDCWRIHLRTEKVLSTIHQHVHGCLYGPPTCLWRFSTERSNVL